MLKFSLPAIVLTTAAPSPPPSMPLHARAALLPPQNLTVWSDATASGYVPASAFDQLPQTQFEMGAGYLQATTTPSYWRIEGYALSVVGLHSAQASLVPTSWTLECRTGTGADSAEAWVQIDSRSGVSLDRTKLMEKFEISPASVESPGCDATRFEFPSATRLADVYLWGEWVSRDACTDEPGFVDVYNHTCAEYARFVHWCGGFGDSTNASSACCVCGGGVYAPQHGQSGRLGEAIAGHQQLVRLHLKAWGCPRHS